MYALESQPLINKDMNHKRLQEWLHLRPFSDEYGVAWKGYMCALSISIVSNDAKANVSIV